MGLRCLRKDWKRIVILRKTAAVRMTGGFRERNARLGAEKGLDDSVKPTEDLLIDRFPPEMSL